MYARARRSLSVLLVVHDVADNVSGMLDWIRWRSVNGVAL